MIRTAAVSLLLLMAGASAIAHRLNLPVTDVAGRRYYYYDVKADDNLYGISQQLDIPVARIISDNPSARDGLSPAMRLYFPVDEYRQTTSQTHTVEKNQSIYGIAHTYGISVQDILDANPVARDGLTTGMVLVIPAVDTAEVTPAGRPADATIRSEQALRATEVEVPEEHPADATIRSEQALRATEVDVPEEELAAAEEAEPVNILMLQPFMLNQSEPERAAQYTLDFYKGFLLAADTLSRSGRPVHVTAVDTEGSADVLRQALASQAFADADIIIAPDDDSQLAVIADAAGDAKLVYNASNVRNTLYTTKPSVIQANTPHDTMYGKAIAAYLTLFDGYTTVFLSRTGGSNDKEAFTSQLRQRLIDEGVSVIDIPFDGNLSADNLSVLSPGTPYVVVPASGRREEFTKITPALKAYRQSLDSPDNLRLFGFPDYVILRGANLQALSDLNTVIYTRFYADTTDPAVIDLARRYAEAYGAPWTDTAPVKAIEGYDTGMFVINMMRANDGDLTDPAIASHGLQQDVSLSDSDAEGYYNSAIYLVNYTPSGTVVKTPL